MRRYLLIFSLFAAFSCATRAQDREVYLFTSFHEPATEGLRFLYSYDGYVWDSVPGVFLRPEVGAQKIMRDPSIAVGSDGVFHLVWTPSWKGDNGIGYASSKDLKTWSAQQHIPVMAFDTTTVNTWAPEIFYDDLADEFIIVWASTIPYKFERGIEEETNNHRLYYTTTRDFVQFTPTKLFYDPGYSSIDAVIVKRGRGDYVLVFKDNTRPERNILAAFGGTPLGPYQNPTPRFTKKLTEGPAVVRVGDDWLIYFDSYGDKGYGAVSTKDFINFTDITDKISIPEGHKHGTIFKTNESILKGLLDE